MEELLRITAARGDSEQVIRLLGEGVKNVPDESGRNALHLAASGGFQNVVAALLSARWDINLQDSAGCTALQRAAAQGHVEVVKQLLKQGANVNIQDKVHGNTALHEASWKGYSKCVQALCQAVKVNLQIKNAGGFAPLHLACQKGHNQSCRELLMANCNPDLQNNYGDTPLHTSARYGHAGVTRILISADCHMSDQNKNGDTALHITAAMGRRKLTRILLEAGCDPNKRNKQNERAKDIAIRKDLSEIIEIIDVTAPIKKKEKRKLNEKKRGKESGSSKDSSARPKEKKKPKNDYQVHFENIVETKWSPYGCHYYPDSKTFPKPKLDSLPQEPLKKGEQYYLDLAGNIRKGPVGIGYTCYCAPFFRHMEDRLNRDKKELKNHIDAAQIRLDKKVTNLEIKTRSQLNEITRSMALERAKCQQRHLHLEQWLIRGSIFRNSEKPKPSDFPLVLLPKSKSLENILEEKCLPNENFYRSMDILHEHLDLEKDLTSEKSKSSSREGKESGKGSSEVGDLGTSDGEEKNREGKKLKKNFFSEAMIGSEKHERKFRRTTREISERIDQVLQNRENADGLGVLCDEMALWRSYHNAYNQWNPVPENKINKENQRIFHEKSLFPKTSLYGTARCIENRRSYHDLLKDESDSKLEFRTRRLSDPRGLVEEPEERSVPEIVSKTQKQHTVKELVAKIQKKTGLIHKSAQKWKESKIKNRERICSGEGKKELNDSESNKPGKSLHNYENIQPWGSSQENLSQLPYRCRNTVYSPSEMLKPYEREEYQRSACYNLNFYDKQYAYNPTTQLAKRSEKGTYKSELSLSRNCYRSGVNAENDLYDYEHSRIYHRNDPRKMTNGQHRPNYSPTQNDSGYSTKPNGGSSTGPSPSLSGQDIEFGVTEIKPNPLQISVQKIIEGKTSSLV